MKTSPRFIALAGIGCALLVALPPAFSMDIMERIVSTQTQFIRREATEYQRKVAEANARAYMAKQLHAVRHGSASQPTPKAGKAGKTAKVEDTPEVKAAKKKLPRYVAIDTVKDKRSAPGTKKDVMIWDTQAETIVGNNVYDVQEVPQIGSTTKFETYSAQYVGTGL
jgi:hypothetical protein